MFVKNNRGINDSQDLPASYLEELYSRIVAEEWIMEEDQGNREVLEAQQMHQLEGLTVALGLALPPASRSSFVLSWNLNSAKSSRPHLHTDGNSSYFKNPRELSKRRLNSNAEVDRIRSRQSKRLQKYLCPWDTDMISFPETERRNGMREKLCRRFACSFWASPFSFRVDLYVSFRDIFRSVFHPPSRCLLLAFQCKPYTPSSVLMQSGCDDVHMEKLLIQGFLVCTHLAAFCGLTAEVELFVSSLAKFTGLTFASNPAETELTERNIQCVRALLELALSEGNSLGRS
eukprot:284818736_3